MSTLQPPSTLDHQTDSNFPSNWHILTLDIPIPDQRKAQIIIDAISPDKPVKSPLLVRRSIKLLSDPVPTIRICLGALTVRQARVSMDHLISDLDLVIETLETFV
ncbi:hypothetical protein CROQUDRAFT_668318 [Cronartium quercuum f. sp. fusiforme G11]|uniref:Transcription factor Pcc1 n=1 Tax=Cronartium quercuum f. sp. fusiforme G11 TaxID=708437 RepID=A0A9P6NWW5_9BASI|nr:hypothetical protein CROQUDRAFT_668318 [Cronartium quercuum f. sp. fusiforme G11]